MKIIEIIMNTFLLSKGSNTESKQDILYENRTHYLSVASAMLYQADRNDIREPYKNQILN